MSKPEKNIDTTKDLPKPKRIALLVNSKSNLLKVQEGIELLWEAKSKGIINWVISHSCDDRNDPEGFDYILQEYAQTNIDTVIVISDYRFAEIVSARLKYKYTQGLSVVQITPENLNVTKIFQNVISGNFSEMENIKFKKREILTPFDVMNFLRS